MVKMVRPDLDDLPVSLPDELLFSRVARMHILTDGGAAKRTLVRLFGGGFTVPASALPNRLEALCSYFGDGEKPELIAEQNTLFPYYRPFLPKERSTLLFAEMLNYDAGGLKTKLGLTASRVGAFNALRICRQCVAFDIEKYGIAYWHRSHQAPGVLLCAEHKIILDDCTRAAQWSRHALWLPKDVPPALVRLNGPFTSAQQSALLEVSEATSSILGSGLPPNDLDYWREVYLNEASHRGLKSGSRRINQNDFIALFRSKWACLEHIPQFTRFLKDPLGWPSALLRKHRGIKHPLKHILVALVLARSWTHLMREPASSSPVHRRDSHTIVSSASRSLLRKAEKDTNTSTAIRLMSERGFSLRSTAQQLGIDTTTVRIYVQAAGGNVLRRRKQLTTAIEDEVCSRLAKGEDFSAIAEETGISSSSVWRILAVNLSLKDKREALLRERTRETYRTRWTLALEISTDKGIKSARIVDPSAYAWLYRNDRMWQKEENLRYVRVPGQQRNQIVDWAIRDVEAIGKLTQAVAEILAEPGPPVRLSATRIALRAGVAALVSKHYLKIPQSIKLLAELSEGVDLYRKRRADYWRRYLEESGIYPVQWKVDRLAGLPAKA